MSPRMRVQQLPLAHLSHRSVFFLLYPLVAGSDLVGPSESPSSSSLLHVLPVLLFLATTGALTYIFWPAIKAATGGADIGVLEDRQGNGGMLPGGKRHILSLVIPAYNEESRLPTMLDATLDYLEANRAKVASSCRRAIYGHVKDSCSDTFEIIIVDDGSKDGTGDVARRYRTRVDGMGPGDMVRLITMKRNSGKGAAVRAGMIRTNGELCLMVDADGATEFGGGLTKVLSAMQSLATAVNQPLPDGMAAVFGSRKDLEKESIARRSPVRTLLMHGFHFFVRALCSESIQDTQCGFKLFTRSAAITLFSNLHLRRWAFDTEVIVIAERLGVPLAEVGVRWHEVDGSKLDTSKVALALASLGMLRDMVCVRACYTLGLWRLER